MAKRPRRSPKSRGSNPNNQDNRSLDRVRAENRILRARIKANNRAAALMKRAQADKRRKRRKAKAPAEYVVSDIQKLKRLTNLGFYQPKKIPTKKNPLLSASQKRAVRSAWKKFQAFTTTEFLAVKPKTKDKKKTAKILEKAKRAGLHTSSKAVFIPRENIVSAEISHNKETGFEIVAKRKFHSSKLNRSGETEHIPFASMDELEAKRKNLERRFKSQARKLKKGQSIRYYIKNKYGSNNVYSEKDFNKMWSMIMTYRTTQAGRYEFVTRLTIGIHTPGDAQHKVITKRELDYMKKSGMTTDPRGRAVPKGFTKRERQIFQETYGEEDDETEE